MPRRIGLAAAIAGVCATFTAPAAFAQAGANQIVTVTSQKRVEDVRQVPLSVSVISGEALKDNQILDFSDLARSIPNRASSTSNAWKCCVARKARSTAPARSAAR